MVRSLHFFFISKCLIINLRLPRNLLLVRWCLQFRANAAVSGFVFREKKTSFESIIVGCLGGQSTTDWSALLVVVDRSEIYDIFKFQDRRPTPTR